jgi:hypothetical protein
MSVSVSCQKSVVGLIATTLLIVGGLFLYTTGSPTSLSGAEPSSPSAGPDGVVLTTPEMSAEITGALREIHEKMWKDLRPEDNAVVWLMVIYGDDALEPPLHDATLEILGIKSLPPSSPLFVPVLDFVNSLEDVPSSEAELRAAELEERLLWAGGEPWNAELNAHLKGYLEANRDTLEMLTQASLRPRYFAPLLAPELPSRLMSASLVVERRLPFLGRMLAARAIMRFDAGDFDGCLSDLMTGHRIANLLAYGSPFDVSVAKAQVIDALIFNAEKVIVESGKLTEDQIEKFRKALADLPPFPPIAQAADLGERAILHQEIELLQQDEDSRIGFFEDSHAKATPASQAKALLAIDWKLAKEGADDVQNQIVKALATRDRSQQNELFDQLDRDYSEWESSADLKSEQFTEEIKIDLKGLSRWVGKNMAMSLRPLYRQRRNAEDRQLSRRTMIQLALALEGWQRKEKSFPTQLDELVPSQFSSIPLDACTDAPFVYRRVSDTEATLMSLGTNQQDDAGMNFNDDVIIRLK